MTNHHDKSVYRTGGEQPTKYEDVRKQRLQNANRLGDHYRELSSAYTDVAAREMQPPTKPSLEPEDIKPPAKESKPKHRPASASRFNRLDRDGK